MKRGALLLALLLPLAAQADRRYVGVAHGLESGAFLYEEHHLLRERDGAPRERLVLYRCPDGRAFARKHVDYSSGAFTPSFTLDDARFGYREGVEVEGRQVRAWVRRDSRTPRREGRVRHTPQLAIDAGFDELVRAKWDALQRGEDVPLDHLVPSRQRSYRFHVRRTGSETIEGAPASVLELSLGGVLGWFAPSIEVSYRDADRRLMRFAGLTNIRENRDEPLYARIAFPLEREAGFDARDWDAALAEPLVSCRLAR